ncbi:hypothetical protein [Mycolicibacterium peregrinum]|uniref:hypothetical protein n=1 Tax=Mycolicibacterium peregrinum TaxID=43304 RepID=UPI000A8DAC70|nr:hypothetical protein [Mycolicibacterium peregrinum]
MNQVKHDQIGDNGYCALPKPRPEISRALISRHSSLLFLLVSVSALAVGACTHQVTGTARAEPAPRIFPDLSAFTPSDPDVFYVPLRGGPSYQFVTPTGVECRITLSSMGCTGRFSTDPYTPTDKLCASAGPKDQAKTSPPYSYTINVSDGDCPAGTTSNSRRLDVGQKLVADWGPQVGAFTCAVGEHGLVACIDPRHNHGFVIEPTGAWTF